MNRGIYRIRFYEGMIKRIKRQLEQGLCHPDWGKKEIARCERFIEKRKKAISKKRLTTDKKLKNPPGLSAERVLIFSVPLTVYQRPR